MMMMQLLLLWLTSIVTPPLPSFLPSTTTSTPTKSTPLLFLPLYYHSLCHWGKFRCD